MEMIISPSRLYSTSKLKFKPGYKTYFSTENVFLFIPNIVDYVRLVFLVFFIVLSHHDMYQLASVCYVISVALDEIDGNLARCLNQTSVFGMLLDILIDEITVFYMCCLLGSIYPQYRMYFQFVTIIDIAGQWMNYQYAAMYRQNDYTRKDNWILNVYFNKKVFTNSWVYGNHVFLLMLYICAYYPGVPVSVFGHETGICQLVAYIAAPWSISRSLIMVYLLVISLSDIGKHDRIIHKLHKN